jgi:hypothetical protein
VRKRTIKLTTDDAVLYVLKLYIGKLFKDVPDELWPASPSLCSPSLIAALNSSNKVMPGMFKLVEAFYGLRISEVERTIQCWLTDVKFLDILIIRKNCSGVYTWIYMLAQVYTAEPGWMTRLPGDVLKCRKLAVQNYLTYNFSPPVAIEGQIRPALFTHGRG